MDNYVVTIARGFGSGGKSIGVQLAKELNINCYENRILTLASQISGLSESLFQEVDEKLTGSYLTNVLKELPQIISPKPEKAKFSSNRRKFEYQAEVIRRLAKSESFVVVGKCADYILRDNPRVVSVYIEAPREYCRNSIMKKMKVSEKEADRLITSTDKYRADYYKFYTGGNYWTNPVNYDITLNSERLGRENCVKAIKNIIKLKLGDVIN